MAKKSNPPLAGWRRLLGGVTLLKKQTNAKQVTYSTVRHKCIFILYAKWRGGGSPPQPLPAPPLTPPPLWVGWPITNPKHGGHIQAQSIHAHGIFSKFGGGGGGTHKFCQGGMGMMGQKVDQ